MKFFAISFVAICLFGAAAAVTMTFYTDAKCATPATSTTDSPNPIVGPLNGCTKLMTQSQLGVSVTIYVKPTACATGGKATVGMYIDDKCTTRAPNVPADIPNNEGTCDTTTSGSQKVTCDPASSVTLASVAVAAAVLAFCM